MLLLVTAHVTASLRLSRRTPAHHALDAGRPTPRAAIRSRCAALDNLCAQYHYPLYCYIRRDGLDHHDAQDALHDFLAKLLRNDSFGAADSERGRLRTFLLTALQRFLANWRRDQRHWVNEVGIDSALALAAAEDRFQSERFAA